MSLLFKIATRNMLRHFRRSFITILSIAIGLAIVVWMHCIVEGQRAGIIEKVVSNYSGHLQIHQKNYLKDKLTQQFFQDPSSQWKDQLPPSSAVSSRIYLPALLSSGEQSAPILLEGVQPQNEALITHLRTNLLQGSYLEEDSDPDCPSRQIYIGKAMAELLNVQVGNKVVIMAQAADGTLGNELLRVKGIFDSKSSDYDKKYAFAPLNCVSKIGAIPGVHEVLIRLPNESVEFATLESIRKLLPHDLKMSSWRETLPSVSSLVKTNQATMNMISLMLFVVATLGAVNTILMNIFERTREMGVQLALGTTPLQLNLIILIECGVLGVISSVLGLFIGLAFSAYHKKFGFDLSVIVGEGAIAADFPLDLIIYPIYAWQGVFSAAFLTVFFTVFAGLYPAFRASRLNPIDTIRT